MRKISERNQEKEIKVEDQNLQEDTKNKVEEQSQEDEKKVLLHVYPSPRTIKKANYFLNQIIAGSSSASPQTKHISPSTSRKLPEEGIDVRRPPSTQVSLAGEILTNRSSPLHNQVQSMGSETTPFQYEPLAITMPVMPPPSYHTMPVMPAPSDNAMPVLPPLSDNKENIPVLVYKRKLAPLPNWDNSGHDEETQVPPKQSKLSPSLFDSDDEQDPFTTASEQRSRTKKKVVSTKGSKQKHRSPPPSRATPHNPFNRKVFDPDTGEEVNVDSIDGLKLLGKQGKRSEETTRKMHMEFNIFLRFCETSPSVGPDLLKSMMQSTLPEQIVANILSIFVRDRINMTTWTKSGVAEPLDTSTMERIFSHVTGILAEKTKYVINGNPVFNVARGNKASAMRDAKREHGKGSRSNQADALSKAEINMCLHSDILSFYTPFGLQALFYFQFCLYNISRVRKEMLNLKRGEIKPIYNADGSPRYMCYVPLKALKKDQGNCSSTSERASKVFTRNAVLPCPHEPKLCPFQMWDEMRMQLNKIPFIGDRKDQYVFHARSKKALSKALEDGFYLPERLGEETFDRMVKDVIAAVGIDVGERKICNLSLRVAAHNLHDMMGIAPETTAQNSGHQSITTQRIYKRGNWDKIALVGGATQVYLHGTPVTVPDDKMVKMRDGTVRRPASFCPELPDPNNESLVSLGLLPLSTQMIEIEIPFSEDEDHEPEVVVKPVEKVCFTFLFIFFPHY